MKKKTLEMKIRNLLNKNNISLSEFYGLSIIEEARLSELVNNKR